MSEHQDYHRSTGLTISKAPRTSEHGLPGLEQYAGTINEEFLTQLQGIRGRKVFKEMSENDAVIGAMLFAIEMFLRPVEWKVEPYDDSAEAKKDAEFVQGVYDDMGHSWADFISEWMAAPIYGFAPFEIVWKIRAGYKDNRVRSSKYTDGKVGIARLAIRHPDSLHEWKYDSNDRDIVAMVQRPAPSFKEVAIPVSKLLLFTMLQRKGNPEGMSLLRRAYVAWYRKKRIEEIEAIGIERELAGLPLFHTPSDWWFDSATESQKQLLEEVKNIARRVRADEQAAIVIPSVFDESSNQLLKFELVSTGGTRAIDTGPAKEYYSRQMAMSILADVLLLGHEKVGSFALSDSKTNLFSNGLGAMLDGIQDAHNQQLIPRILRLNGMDTTKCPTLIHGDIESPDLDVVGEYVSRLAGAGLPLFPTEEGDLERALFRIANLPEDAVDGILERAEENRQRMAELQNAGNAGVQPGQNGMPGGGNQDGRPTNQGKPGNNQ
jgi:hypothetical protein